MELVGVLLGLLGIAAAIYIPLKIEALRRPKLRIQWAADANNPGMFGGPTRIAHIAVVNEPIEGWLGKWLLRNPATGCQVMLTYRSRSDEKTLSTPGKWSAKPEPLQWLPVQNPDGSQGIYQYADTEKLPDMLVYDISPGRRGGVVAVALKRDGERQAYAFGWLLYAALPDGPLADASLELPHDAYEVTVEAEAGGIECSARFLLHNEGDHHTGLRLDSAMISGCPMAPHRRTPLVGCRRRPACSGRVLRPRPRTPRSPSACPSERDGATVEMKGRDDPPARCSRFGSGRAGSDRACSNPAALWRCRRPCERHRTSRLVGLIHAASAAASRTCSSLGGKTSATSLISIGSSSAAS